MTLKLCPNSLSILTYAAPGSEHTQFSNAFHSPNEVREREELAKKRREIPPPLLCPTPQTTHLLGPSGPEGGG